MSQINSVVNILYDSIRLPDVCIQVSAAGPQATENIIDWCPHCPRAVRVMTTAKSTTRLESRMEKEYEQRLAREVEQGPLPWRLHPIYNVPFCGPECTRCTHYLRHLSQAMNGGAASDSDVVPTDEDSDGTESDDDTGWQPPDEDSDAEDAGDDELRAQMRNIYLRQSAIGRLRTNDLFQKDPAIFGRTQSPIADLMTRIFEIEHEHEVLEAEVYAVAQRLGSTQALLEELQEQHLRLDADRQRKRPTLESAAVDLTTNVERLHSPTEVMDIDPDQSVTRTVQASVRDVSVRTSEEKSSKELLRELQGQLIGMKMPAATEPAEQLARWIQNHKIPTNQGSPSSSS
ncbi:hypothetical protein B0H12DRAFT_1079794 [Mycena haematopus]|nr:hypothetical protein B0H12DRAFT_1079794 [Mycena haematopus]